MTEMSEILGRSKKHEQVKDYEASDSYSEQGDYRIVKDLVFTYHVLEPNPTLPSAGDIVTERLATRGDVVDVEELGPMYLKKGEDLGSFYTTDELKAFRGPQVREVFALKGGIPEQAKELVAANSNPSSSGGNSEDNPGDNPGHGGSATAEFSTMGAHEIAEYMEENRPGVNQTVALAQGDPETAKRVLEAENIVTDNDPRSGVEAGLTRIIGKG